MMYTRSVVWTKSGDLRVATQKANNQFIPDSRRRWTNATRWAVLSSTHIMHSALYSIVWFATRQTNAKQYKNFVVTHLFALNLFVNTIKKFPSSVVSCMGCFVLFVPVFIAKSFSSSFFGLLLLASFLPIFPSTFDTTFRWQTLSSRIPNCCMSNFL